MKLPVELRLWTTMGLAVRLEACLAIWLKSRCVLEVSPVAQLPKFSLLFQTTIM